MKLIARIRVLITAVVLASYSPFGPGFGLDDGASRHAGHLAISMFIGRRTRVAASQQFDVANRVRFLQISESRFTVSFAGAPIRAGFEALDQLGEEIPLLLQLMSLDVDSNFRFSRRSLRRGRT